MDTNTEIYTKSKKISFPNSITITFSDIDKISKELGLTKSIGNTIDLPLTIDWEQIMTNDPLYNIVDDTRFYNKRRILFYVPIDNINKITTFSTDYSINKKSVLTNNDVQDIINAVIKISNEKIKYKDVYDTLIDPITLDLLVNPIIASDGITYSRSTLETLFNNSRPNNPLSPITRKELTCINGDYGIKNILANKILDLFI
jgi:hypothetical protein